MKYWIDIDKTLGDTLFLVGVVNWFDYVDGIKSNNVKGVKLQVVCVDRNFERISVKVETKDIEKYKNLVANDKVQIKLINAVGSVYSFNNRSGLSVVSDDIEVLS